MDYSYSRWTFRIFLWKKAFVNKARVPDFGGFAGVASVEITKAYMRLHSGIE